MLILHLTLPMRLGTAVGTTALGRSKMTRALQVDQQPAYIAMPFSYSR
jgi:hypothetical protein